jgi:putative ABC transport system permease protein
VDGSCIESGHIALVFDLKILSVSEFQKWYSFSSGSPMLKNYFITAWRTLLKNKGFSLTNILGLFIGMTCSILIFLWVHDELSYDRFHRNYSSIYKVMANRDFKNRIFTDPNMVLPLSGALETGHPQIRTAVEMTYPEEHILAYGDRRLKQHGYTVSGHFFDLFTWHFLKGDPRTAIADPSSIVLTQSAAKALFGDADPINRAFTFDKARSYKVSAVIADPPGNSTFVFDFVKAFNYSDPDIKASMNQWYNSSWNVFVELAPGTNPNEAEKIINAVKRFHSPDDKVSTYFLFPMNKWRLYSDFKDGKNVGGMIEYVRLFSAIAIIILLIACINFMNLSTARSDRRAKEVGIRKTLGSNRRQLRLQFLLESVLLTIVAFILSLLAVYLLLPAFNALVDKHLVWQAGDPVFWIALAAMVVFTGAVAGSYPAFYLSSFQAIKVLKGGVRAGWKAVTARRVLVVAQFVVSILLISATFIVYNQLQYVKHRDLGYDPNNLIEFWNSDGLTRSFSAFKQDLLSSGKFSAVTRTNSPITAIYWRSVAPDWEGKPAGLQVIVDGQMTDAGYTKTLGIRMLEGKDFTGTAADSANMLLNKAAVDAMHLTHPLGRVLRYGPKAWTVIGVLDNVTMDNPFRPVDPLLVYYNPASSPLTSVRLKEGVAPQDAVAVLKTLVKKYDADVLFDYHFVDEEFGKKFVTEELIGKVIDIFAGLAIFICCLGLAGLASFTMEKRLREFGIRKVLGATVSQLLGLISGEFLRLALIAFAISVPLSWWAMVKWLEQYTYRVNISPWVFVCTGGLILLLTLVVVSANTIRSAMRNPVKTLRSE